MSSYHQLVEKQRAFYRSGGTDALAGRKARVQRVKEMLTEYKKAIDDAIFKDLGRRESDVEYSLPRVDEVLNKIDEWVQPVKYPVPAAMNEANDDVYMLPEPLGVVLVIGPWNFPLLTCIPFVHAIAAGNTVIFKPSEIVPTFSRIIAEAIGKFFDEKEFACVEGGVAETTELLKERFDHILYTGCPPVAKIIMAAAAKHLTPVTLELGGKNPVVVEDDADLDVVVEAIHDIKIGNCGQICISMDYLLTTEKTKPKLVEALRKHFDKIGDLREFEEYARIVSERHFDRLTNVLSKTKGKILYKTAQEPDRKTKFLPLYFIEADFDDELMKEEIFGPILPIITVPSFDAALDYIKNHEKPLASYLYTKDQTKVRRFLRETSSGMPKVNDNLSAGSGLPFGGVGNSGMGRIHSKWGFDTFTHEKPVVLRNGIGKGLNLGL